jgi:sugar/nucleoside kinase (ribokinase family)
MLGKMQSLDEIRWDRFEQVVGREALARVFLDAKLISMVNWTMTPHMTEIWHALAELLESDPRPPRERPQVFIDLADPEKRTAADILAALTLATRFASACGVILGLNHKEANQVADVLGLAPVVDAADTEGLRRLACDIRGRLDLLTVVIHPRHGAAGARVSGEGEIESVWFTGPFVTHPRLSTGAGDNFNAGFCTGCLAGLDLTACLCVGVAASGFYVREARSADLAELADFCGHLPQPAALP